MSNNVENDELKKQIPSYSFEDHVTPNGTIPISEPAEKILQKLLRTVQFNLLDTDEKKECVASLLTSNHPQKQLSCVSKLIDLGITKLTFMESDKNLRYLTLKKKPQDKEGFFLITILSTDHRGTSAVVMEGISLPDSADFMPASDDGFYLKNWMKQVGAKSYLTGKQFIPDRFGDSFYCLDLPPNLAAVYDAFLLNPHLLVESITSPETIEGVESTSQSITEQLNEPYWNAAGKEDFAIENMTSEQRKAYSSGKEIAARSNSDFSSLDEVEKPKYEFYKRVYADLVTASFQDTDSAQRFILKKEFCILHEENSLPHRLLECLDSVKQDSAVIKAIEFIYAISEEDLNIACSEEHGKELRDSVQRVIESYLNTNDATVILNIYDKKTGFADTEDWSVSTDDTDKELTFKNQPLETQQSDWTGIFEDGQKMLEAVANLNTADQKRFKENEDGFKYEIYKQIRISKVMTRQQRETAVRILNRLDLPAPEGGLRIELQDDLVILSGKEATAQEYLEALKKGLKHPPTLNEMTNSTGYISTIKRLLETGMGAEEFAKLAKPILDELNPE